MTPKKRCKASLCLFVLFCAIVLQWSFLFQWHRRAAEDTNEGIEGIFSPTTFREDDVISISPVFRRKINFPPHRIDPARWVIFYHIYIPTHSAKNRDNALRIVREQLDKIRGSYASKRQGNNTLVLYSTIGASIPSEDMMAMCQPEMRCVNIQVLGSGFEDKTLRKVHAYCSQQPNVTVTYIHNKGSHHNRHGSNDMWRNHMTMAVTSRECYESVGNSYSDDESNTNCNVCGLLFQSIPSLHFPGNFWTARCDYIRELRQPAVYVKTLNSTLDQMDLYTEQGFLTRQLYNSTEDWTTGRGRYASEQWVASYPFIVPCDVSRTLDLRYWKTELRLSSDFVWHLAPRLSLLDKHWQIQPRPNQNAFKDQTSRIRDYHLLPGLLIRWWTMYQTLPPRSSWVWRHFPDGEYWADRFEQDLENNLPRENFMGHFLKMLAMNSAQNFRKSKTDLSVKFQSAPWAVFYHVYVPRERDVNHIVEEQLAELHNSYAVQSLLDPLTVYYSLVGNITEDKDPVGTACSRFAKLRCVVQQKELLGNEDITLTNLHDFCQEYTNLTVIYFHSKGSFHDSPENKNWRRHLLAAVTSADCLDSTRAIGEDASVDRCHVCGLQYYPVWASFFPGNFFAGQCSYIQHLLPPKEHATGLSKIVQRMNVLKAEGLFTTDLYSPKREGNLGENRFAFEQWVGSHPSLRPCDLSRTANFHRWLQAEPDESWDWQMAPRHDIWAPWNHIQTGKRRMVMSNKTRRMRDYFLLAGMLFKWQYLYNNSTPPTDSWIFEWFPDGQEWRRAIEAYGGGNVVEVMTRSFRDGIDLTTTN